MVRTAMIGVSGYGRIIYDLCQECVQRGEMVLSAVVIRTPAKVPDLVADLEKTACRIFSNADEMFAAMKGELDLVCIPTGIETHAPLSIAAMRAGANVMVEKPAAGSVEEVESMERVSQETGKFVAIGFQDIYRSDIQSLKKDLISGKWGVLQSVSVLGSWPRPFSYYARNDWAGQLHSNGFPVFDSPANNALAHYLNLGLFFMGEEFASSAGLPEIEAELYRAYDIQSFDTIVSRSKSDSGKVMHFAVTHVSEESFEPVISLETDQFKVVLKDNGNQLYDLQGNFIEDLDHTDVWAGRKNILPTVIKVMKGEDVLYCDLSIARRQTEFISSLHHQYQAQDFKSERVKKVQVGKLEHLCVDGLFSAMKKASEQTALLEELHFDF